jgi:hypothetical protein
MKCSVILSFAPRCKAGRFSYNDMSRAVEEVLIEAIGEEAAKKAIDALQAESEAIREGRPNICIMIVFDHDGLTQWGKLVTRFTRAPHDKLDFENATES